MERVNTISNITTRIASAYLQAVMISLVGEFFSSQKGLSYRLPVWAFLQGQGYLQTPSLTPSLVGSRVNEMIFRFIFLQHFLDREL